MMGDEFGKAVYDEFWRRGHNQEFEEIKTNELFWEIQDPTPSLGQPGNPAIPIGSRSTIWPK